MLRNVKKPFTVGNYSVLINNSPRYFDALHWTTNNAGGANGNVDATTGGGRLLLWVWDSSGNLSTITNGKLYQTVTLEAGSYKFDAISDGSNSSGYTVYVVAATGSELPDIANIQSTLASQQIPTPFTAGIRLSVEFTLTATTQVHLGFVGTLTGQQQVYFDEVQLWKLR